MAVDRNVTFRPAVKLSWTADFVRQDSLKALELHIQEQMLEVGAYARYCSIIQSSGMAKLRLLDEFGKNFLIPVNLRPKDSKGMPCPLRLHGLSNPSLRLSPCRR